MFGDRRVVRHWLIAREDPSPEEIRRARVEGELEVAERITVCDAFIEPGDQAIRGLDLHGAPYLVARHETQRHGVDEAEQAVPAARQTKELAVSGAAARAPLAVCAYERQRFHVVHERTQREATTMHVRGDCPANAQSIGARLLLADPPLVRRASLILHEPRDQLRPLDP